jgi:ABC-type sugar transport system ATPase subunit
VTQAARRRRFAAEGAIMAGLDIRKLCKSYGQAEILKDVDLTIEDGSFVVLVGPSGCGKSTLLRMIAGLETITSGTLTIGGTTVNDLPPAKRGIAMVFQSYALYPHMNVYGNMAFGLRFAGTPKDEIDRRVRKAASILQLDALLERRPRDLSGGQRQRVAIGRAIVREPEVFLFDEPLSNLDAALRVATRIEIAKLHQLLKATIVYVTHDQVEAMTLADVIVVMNKGRIEQIGKPLELYYRPANRFVAGFIGSPAMNFVPAQVRSNGPDGLVVALEGGSVATLDAAAGLKESDAISIGIRPEHLSLGGQGPVRIEGVLDLVERLGETGYAYVKLPSGTTATAEVKGDVAAQTGSTVALTAGREQVHVFDAAGQAVRA